MTIESASSILDDDKKYVWHPYSPMPDNNPVFVVKSADGVYLTLENNDRLIDGMSSWWSAIHGYNVPELNAAIRLQLNDMAHVMFGGLTHSLTCGQSLQNIGRDNTGQT